MKIKQSVWITLAAVCVCLLVGYLIRAFYARSAAFKVVEQGVQCLRENDYDAAMRKLTAAVERYPEALEEYFSRAFEIRHDEADQRAADDYEASQQLGQRAKKTLEAFALARYGDHNLSLSAFTEALKLDPNNPVLLRGRAIQYAAAGLVEEADADRRAAKLHFPKP
jgi:tetratricopeptide (TPR) repeat protein